MHLTHPPNPEKLLARLGKKRVDEMGKLADDLIGKNKLKAGQADLLKNQIKDILESAPNGGKKFRAKMAEHDAVAGAARKDLPEGHHIELDPGGGASPKKRPDAMRTDANDIPYEGWEGKSHEVGIRIDTVEGEAEDAMQKMVDQGLAREKSYVTIRIDPKGRPVDIDFENDVYQAYRDAGFLKGHIEIDYVGLVDLGL